MQTPRRNADKVTASSLARYVPSHTAFARGLPICIHLSFHLRRMHMAGNSILFLFSIEASKGLGGFGKDSSAQLWGRGRKMSLRHLLGAVVVASCLHAGGALSGSSSMARPCALRAGEVMSGDRAVVADAKQWRRPGRNDKSAQLIKDSAVLSCLSL